MRRTASKPLLRFCLTKRTIEQVFYRHLQNIAHLIVAKNKARFPVISLAIFYQLQSRSKKHNLSRCRGIENNEFIDCASRKCSASVIKILLAGLGKPVDLGDIAAGFERLDVGDRPAFAVGHAEVGIACVVAALVLDELGVDAETSPSCARLRPSGRRRTSPGRLRDLSGDSPPEPWHGRCLPRHRFADTGCWWS